MAKRKGHWEGCDDLARATKKLQVTAITEPHQRQPQSYALGASPHTKSHWHPHLQENMYHAPAARDQQLLQQQQQQQQQRPQSLYADVNVLLRSLHFESLTRQQQWQQAAAHEQQARVTYQGRQQPQEARESTRNPLHETLHYSNFNNRGETT